MNDYYYEPNQHMREQNTYQTGRTDPPKRRSGLIALLLVSVIFFGGIASAMGVMNIRLTQQLQEQKTPEAAMSFYQATEASVPPETTLPQKQVDHVNADWTLDINQSPQSSANIPQENGLSLQEIYQKNIDSVVSIICTLTNGSSSGTGVVLSADGYLLTNCHVVENAQQIEVLFTDGRTLPASLVGLDAISDLAVLYVQAEDLTPAQFGDSAALRVGDAVAAIGDPLGVELRGTMTDGIVSAINRNISTSGRTMTLIQTNAALNSGNSGGPLLNCYGQVVGINTMKIGDYMSDAGVEGLGFAIPSATVKEVVDQLLQQGYVSGRPSLGFEYETVSVFLQIYSHLPKGIYITQVLPGSDAESKGLSVGDILLSIDNTRITDADELKTLLYSYQPGDIANVVIYRSGRQYVLDLMIDEVE